jgi:hypothetical protein
MSALLISLIGWFLKLKGNKMEKEIIGGDVGPETHVDLKIKDGAIVVEVAYKGTDGFATVQAGLLPEAFLDKLKALIPGTFDDIAIEAIKAAIK